MNGTSSKRGIVWFIGAGPGDPELITVKGQRLIREADLVVYAGSLVPQALVSQVKPGAKVVDSAPLALEEIHAMIKETVLAGGMVARVHTGDPALYGAMREQKALLDAEGIESAVVPGVSAAFAAAAAAGVAFTVPETVQSFVVTRLHGRTPVPPGQGIRDYAPHGGSMAVYLSAGDPEGLAGELRAARVPEDTPLVLASRVGWPDQAIVRSTLGNLVHDMQKHGFTRQTVVLVLPGEGHAHAPASRLYDAGFTHGYRKGR